MPLRKKLGEPPLRMLFCLSAGGNSSLAMYYKPVIILEWRVEANARTKRNKIEPCAGVARVPGRSAPDAAGVCRIFGAGPRLRHLCAVAGSAGLAAAPDGHGGVWRLAGICAGVAAAGQLCAGVGLSDGPDDPGAAPLLRPDHAAALPGLRPAQRLHDLRHER